MLSVCLWMSPINFWMPESSFVKLGMALELNSVTYFVNPCHQSVSLWVSLLSLLGNGSVNTLSRQRIHSTIEKIIWPVCLWACMWISLSLLGNNSVETYQRQRRIVGGVVFYTVRVVSKESRRLVLSRISCNVCNFRITRSIKSNAFMYE
jgi:hypothetical protein